MSHNDKKSSAEIATKAAQTLRNPKSSALEKQLAGSALAQYRSAKQTSAQLEERAGQTLGNPQSSELARELAGSVVSQSSKSR